MGNRVLVTGSTGFIGSNLVRRLIDENYEVHILTRKTSNKWRLLDILPKLNDYTVDLLEFEKLKRIIENIKPEIIFHLANAGVYGGWHLPEKQLIETNFLGTVNLINACNDIEYKYFVNTGSSSEYGPKKDSMKETDICEPVNMYGITKCAATLYGKLIAQRDNKTIITLRLFSPFGPYDDKRRLITYTITNSLQNNDLSFANPMAVRDYIFIEDVIDAYIKAIKTSHIGGQIFNIGSGQQHSVGYVVDKIIELTGNKVKPKWGSIPKRPNEPSMWQADITKANNILNWKPKYSLEEGLYKTVKWYENRKRN